MQRRVIDQAKGMLTQDGAGVKLVRVLGPATVESFDPILMLDSFDSDNPADYNAGFPMHPHRGIETISYLSQGEMVHRDSIGNEAAIGDGEVQWMTAGSGIMHEEMLPGKGRILGVQLWLNLAQKDKMVAPAYQSIHQEDIEEIEIPGGKLRLLAGDYKDHQGFQSSYLPFDYYAIHLAKGQSFTLDTESDRSVMLFTLLGRIEISGLEIEEKTAVKLSEGDYVTIKAVDDIQLLFMSSKKLEEPVAWGGPIVMNSREELHQASIDLRQGTFVKEGASY